jgi:hypothetical protein
MERLASQFRVVAIDWEAPAPLQPQAGVFPFGGLLVAYFGPTRVNYVKLPKAARGYDQ